MATTGVAGSATFADAQNTLINRWSLDIGRDIEDVSSFDSVTNGKEKIGLLHMATGKIEGFCDNATLPAGLGSLKLENNQNTTAADLALSGGATGVRYEFTAILENIRIQVSKTGVNRYSAQFRSQSVVTNPTS